jgi:hypothetical protein
VLPVRCNRGYLIGRGCLDTRRPVVPQSGSDSGRHARLVPVHSLTQLTLYALKLDTIGFGGPVALARYMHRGGQQFAETTTKASSGEWHTLGLSVKGGHFRVFFDDKPLSETDSVTQFEDLATNGYDAKRW